MDTLMRSSSAAEELEPNPHPLQRRFPGTPANNLPKPPTYTLLDHVYACVHGSEVVLLDLKQNKYLSIDLSQSRLLGTLVTGWPTDNSPAAEHPSPSETDIPKALLDSLLERKLIAADTLHQPGILRDSMPPVPQREITSSPRADAPSIRISDFIRFISASLTARLSLRYLPLERTIENVKSLHRGSSPRPTPTDRSTLNTAIFRYRALQPWFRSSKDACLFESLALARFLVLQGIYPVWVFGVRTDPFTAHCWLQVNDIVLNETMETASRFTPIMAVHTYYAV
jgi:hypothetical protein